MPVPGAGAKPHAPPHELFFFSIQFTSPFAVGATTMTEADDEAAAAEDLVPGAPAPKIFILMLGSCK